MLIHYPFRHKITAIFWGREINSHQGLVIRHVKKKRKEKMAGFTLQVQFNQGSDSLLDCLLFPT